MGLITTLYSSIRTENKQNSSNSFSQRRLIIIILVSAGVVDRGGKGGEGKGAWREEKT